MTYWHKYHNRSAIDMTRSECIISVTQTTKTTTLKSLNISLQNLMANSWVLDVTDYPENLHVVFCPNKWVFFFFFFLFLTFYVFGPCNIMAANRTHKEVDQEKCCSNNVWMDWIKSCHPLLSLTLLHYTQHCLVNIQNLMIPMRTCVWLNWNGSQFQSMRNNWQVVLWQRVSDSKFSMFLNTALLKLPVQKGEYCSPPGMGMSQLDGAGNSRQSLRIIRNKMDLKSHFPIFDVLIIGVSQLLKFTNI